MTEKIYDKDPYLTEFSATVTGCFINADATFDITLDRTAFFPNEGGQSCDKGTLNGLDVLNVELKDDDIVHVVKVYIPEGTTVECMIDWEHRFSNMQMHTGEHIFSGLVHSKFGFDNVGFHLSDNSATMDYNGKLSESEIHELEALANEVIWSNRKVRTFFPDESELETLDYRSKSGIKGAVRLVEIEGVDLCACCAPHVALTGEIGLIKIVSWESYKGGTRLNYLCGMRALADYSRLFTLESELSKLLNASKGDIFGAVEKVKTDLSDLEFKAVGLKRDKISEACYVLKKPILFMEGDNADLLRFAVSELKSRFNGAVAAFAGDDETGYRFILECDSHGLEKLFDDFKFEFDVKGGGRSGSYMGNVEGKQEDIVTFLESDKTFMI